MRDTLGLVLVGVSTVLFMLVLMAILAENDRNYDKRRQSIEIIVK